MRYIFFILSILFSSSIIAQESDVVLVKNKKGVTIKVLGQGTFIKAISVQGHELNGFINRIHNDSIYLSHGQTKLVSTALGAVIDTFFYQQQHHYLDLYQLYYDATSQFGGKQKFRNVFIDKILAVGSIGFIILETVNGLRSNQKFSDNNRLESIGIAAGVYVGSRFIKKARSRKYNASKYQFEYIKSGSIPALLKSNKEF